MDEAGAGLRDVARRRRLRAKGLAAQGPGQPPEGGLAMGAVGHVVAAAVVLEDRKGILFVQPLSVEAADQQTLNLRQGQRWSFF